MRIRSCLFSILASVLVVASVLYGLGRIWWSMREAKHADATRVLMAINSRDMYEFETALQELDSIDENLRLNFSDGDRVNDFYMKPPLYVAIRKNRPKMVAYLLEQGADPYFDESFTGSQTAFDVVLEMLDNCHEFSNFAQSSDCSEVREIAELVWALPVDADRLSGSGAYALFHAVDPCASADVGHIVIATVLSPDRFERVLPFVLQRGGVRWAEQLVEFGVSKDLLRAIHDSTMCVPYPEIRDVIRHALVETH